MKKGQSALEYLVTYGWAILAIVIVAALLWALGIFNPGGLVGAGNKASGFTFNILDQKYATTILTFRIGNTMGQKVTITGISIDGVAGSVTATDLVAGEAKTIDFTVASCGTAGDKYTDKAVVINYDSAITNKTDAGIISGVCS